MKRSDHLSPKQHTSQGQRVTNPNRALRAASGAWTTFRPCRGGDARVIQAGHKIIVTGIGKSGAIGAKIASTLSSTARRAWFSTPSTPRTRSRHGLHGDLVLILSYSGETEEVARLIPSLKRIGTRIVALTAIRVLAGRKPRSISMCRCPAKHARSSARRPPVHRHARRRRCAGHGAARSARVQKEDFATFHPGGTLGRNLL